MDPLRTKKTGSAGRSESAQQSRRKRIRVNLGAKLTVQEFPAASLTSTFGLVPPFSLSRTGMEARATSWPPDPTTTGNTGRVWLAPEQLRRRGDVHQNVQKKDRA